MLDCRGLACPQPVMQVKELVDQGAPNQVEVMVDNEAASQNVSRFLGSQGYDAVVKAQGGDFLVKAVRDPAAAPSPAPDVSAMACPAPAPGEHKQLVFVRADRIGQGDDELGRGLMKNFLATLGEMGPELWRIIFVNSGVKLCIQGAPTLEVLQELEKSGVSILVCGTCLNHFDLLKQKAVGETTNMLDVVTSLQVASKVISI